MTLRRYVIHSLLKVLYQSGWNLWRKSPKFVWLLCFASLLVTTYLCSAFVLRRSLEIFLLMVGH